MAYSSQSDLIQGHLGVFELENFGQLSKVPFTELAQVEVLGFVVQLDFDVANFDIFYRLAEKTE